MTVTWQRDCTIDLLSYERAQRTCPRSLVPTRHVATATYRCEVSVLSVSNWGIVRCACSCRNEGPVAGVAGLPRMQKTLNALEGWGFTHIDSPQSRLVA